MSNRKSISRESVSNWTSRPSQRAQSNTPRAAATTARAGRAQIAQSTENRHSGQDTSPSDEQLAVTPGTSNLQHPAPSAEQSQTGVENYFHSDVMREALARPVDLTEFLSPEKEKPTTSDKPKKGDLFSRARTTYNDATEKKKKKAAVEDKTIVSNHSPARPDNEGSHTTPARPSKPAPQTPPTSGNEKKSKVPRIPLGKLVQGLTSGSTPRTPSVEAQSPKRVTFHGQNESSPDSQPSGRPSQRAKQLKRQSSRASLPTAVKPQATDASLASPRRPAVADLPPQKPFVGQQHLNDIDTLLADFQQAPLPQDSLQPAPQTNPADFGENTLQEFPVLQQLALQTQAPGLPTNTAAQGSLGLALDQADFNLGDLNADGLDRLIALLGTDIDDAPEKTDKAEKKSQ